jgi:hypothetical protein
VIELVSGTSPIHKRPYKMAPKQLAKLEDQIKVLGKCYIYPSSSQWGGPVIYVRRKDGTQWMCVDYHALNEVTV